MEETAAGTEQARLGAEKKRLKEFLKAAVGHFRTGEDTAGMDCFLSALEELEHVVEADRNSLRPQIDMNKLLPALRGLYFYMRNQDIAGMTDLLEDTAVPLSEEWLKERDNP